MKKQKELKFFCVKCGSLMNKKQVLTGYNPITGNQEFVIFWKCPHYSWFSWHSKWKTDEDGRLYMP